MRMNKKNQGKIVAGLYAVTTVLTVSIVGIAASATPVTYTVDIPENQSVYDREFDIESSKFDYKAFEQPVEEVVESAPAPEPEPVIEEYVEPVAETYSEPAYAQPQAYVGNSFMADGVWHDGNYRYTWYSSNDLYHYRTNEWIAGTDGIYRDSEGYVVVASSDYAQGTVISGTPFGDVKVYDSGCASGTLDVYTNF